MSSKISKSHKEQFVSSLVKFEDPRRRDESPKDFIDALMNFINSHPGWVKTGMGGGEEEASVELVDSIVGLLKVLDKFTEEDNDNINEEN
ncbi:hypothetical protein BD770DRAFT_444444 [Pilaira anomala]|nr:hypothetical protein BD770DRAFT_444444 [Pilaira anomala]